MDVSRPMLFRMRSLAVRVTFVVLLIYSLVFLDSSGVFKGFVLEAAAASPATIQPNGNGTTNQGTPTPVGCSGGGNYDCLNDGVTDPTFPVTGSDYITWGRNQAGFFQMDNSITDASVVTSITVHLYHKEGGSNMRTDVSLWDSTEATQFGTTQNATVRTTAGWDSLTISGLSLNQTQLDGLKVRIGCTRPSGGGATDCIGYAMYAVVTYTPVINVTVSTIGSQQNLEIGTANQHVGGAFVIAENTSSRNITSITITENGTVNAQTNLANIKLFYETAVSCAAQTYNGTESQYGSTATSFNAADGTATFTGSVGITTSLQMCVYVVVDVGTGASISENLEVQITNPSTQVVGSGSPIVSPATPVAIASTSNLEKVDLTQIHYHWRNDDGSETGATSATGGSQDTSINDFPRGVTYRLRLEVSNEGNKTSASTQFRLEYAMKSGGSCSASTGWTDVGAAGGDWDMSLSGNIADGDTTNVVSGANGAVTDENASFYGTGMLRETTSLTSATTLTSTQFAEMEYSVIASSTASDGATYCFRVTNNGTPLNTYTSAYPEATIASDLLVTATSTQVALVTIPTTGQYAGGGFVVTDSSVGANTITSITLHASGSVDTTADVTNVKLRYEYDTTAPYDCTGESYAGTETQFGSTATSFSSGQATFAGSISATPTQGICLYVEYDVGSGVSNGETLDLYFSNASSDFVLGSGSIGPASIVEIPGETTFVKSNVVQTSYHWRDNQGTETTAGSLTGIENTPYTELPKTTVVRMRFGVANTGGADAANYQYRLEWAQRVTTCSAATGWEDVDTADDVWSMAASQLADGSNTSNIATTTGGVTDVGTFTAVAGQKDVSSQTGNITLTGGSFAELEYSVTASSSITEGGSYCFRVTNNGTPLDSYTNYARATIKLDTDFAVYRGVADILSGQTTVTLTEGVDYDLQFNSASRAFVRITNSHMTGGGPAAGSTGNNASADVTAYISNPGNITSSIIFTRAGTTNDTQVAWEVVEYIGDSGGENEFVVRSAAASTYVAANTTLTTGTVSGVVDDADIAVFITGQGNPDGGRFDYNTGLSTAAWNAGPDTATFTRGEANNIAANVSYAIVEFTGANWKVQRIPHTYASTGVTETSSMTAVNSISRAFVHAQHQAGTGLDTHANFGHEVWLSSIGAVSFRLNGAASTPGGHTSVAWVIENTQSTGDRMIVTRTNNSIPAGGGGLTSTNVNITKTLDDFSVASIFVTNSTDGTGRTFPEPMVSAYLISDTQYTLDVSDDGDTVLYRTEVVEWPTASRKLIQDDFWIFEDNDTLTPTTTRGSLGENEEMTANNDPLALGESVRLRMNLQVTAAAMPAGIDSFLLQYAERPPATSCSALGTWQEIGDASSSTALWRAHAGAPADGTTLPSLLLSLSTVAGTYEENSPTALVPNQALVNDLIEYDWNIEHNGAADKTDYCFRMVESDETPLTSYSTYPVLRTVGYDPIVSNWRFYSDVGSATPVVPLDAENTTPSDIDNTDPLKLRLSVVEQSGAAGVDVKFKLQYSEYPNFSVVSDVVSTSSCTANALWCYYDGAGVDNAILSSSVISDTDTLGTHNETTSTTTATFDQPAFSIAEYEFTIMNAGARVNAVYYFRLYNVNTDEVVTASTSYPSVLVSTSSMAVNTIALNAGDLADDDYTVDATTTPTAVPFGELPFNTGYVAAQRFDLTTNATEGYSVLAFVDQQLTNSYGTTIPAVTGTNAVPTDWATGCPTSQTGCFGYHSGDDVLAGPSTRFAPTDSFAAFTTTPTEVFYSSVPGNDVEDMVYKIQVGEEQPAGDYTASLTYLIIPVY